MPYYMPRRSPKRSKQIKLKDPNAGLHILHQLCIMNFSEYAYFSHKEEYILNMYILFTVRDDPKPERGRKTDKE